MIDSDTQSPTRTDRLAKEIGYWLTSCKLAGLSEQSIKIYTVSVNNFYWWCRNEGKLEDLQPKAIRPEHISEFVAYLKAPNEKRWGEAGYRGKEKLSTASIATYFRGIRIFFNWLEDKGAIDKTPIKRGFKTTTKKDPVTTVYSKVVEKEQLKKLFDHLTRPDLARTYNGARNLAIISLLLDSGMRRGELLSIKIEDFDWGRNRVTIRGKTGLRVCFFSRSTEQSLLEYKDKHRCEQTEYLEPTAPFWFTSDSHPLTVAGLDGIVAKVREATGVNFSAHKLRHTFATLMVQKISIYDLSRMLGHSSVVMTEIYTNSNTDHLQASYHANSPLTTLDVGQPKGAARRGRPKGSKNSKDGGGDE